MYNALYADIEDHIKAHPDEKEISLGADDGMSRCECDECLKLTALDDDGTGIPTSAMQYIHLMNKVGRHFKNKHPDVRFNMLVYMNVDRAPVHLDLYKLEPNVGVGVALLWKNHCRPTFSCERAKGSVADWAKMVDSKVGIYNWDYYANFASYLIPFPNYDIMGPNFRYYADNGQRGFYSQMQFTFNGDLMELHYWLYMKLCWNPYADVDTLIDEFCRNVYGDAGKYVKEYIKILTCAKNRQIGAYYGCYVMETDHYLTANDCYRIFKLGQQIDNIARRGNMPENQRDVLMRSTIGMKILTVIRYNDIKSIAEKNKDKSLKPREDVLNDFEACMVYGDNRRGQDWCESLGTPDRFRGMVKFNGVQAYPDKTVQSVVIEADKFTRGSRASIAKDDIDGVYAHIDTNFKNEDEYQVFMNMGNAAVAYDMQESEIGEWYIFSRLRAETAANSDPAVAYIGTYEDYSQDGFRPSLKEFGGWGRVYTQQKSELKIPGKSGETMWKTHCLGKFKMKPSSQIWACVGIGSKIGYVDVKNFVIVDPKVVDASMALGKVTGTNGAFKFEKDWLDGFTYARLDFADVANEADRAAVFMECPLPVKEEPVETAVLVELLINTDTPLDVNAVKIEIVKPAKTADTEDTVVAERYVMGNAGEEAWQIVVLDPLVVESGMKIRIHEGSGENVKAISLKRVGILDKRILGL